MSPRTAYVSAAIIAVALVTIAGHGSAAQPQPTPYGLDLVASAQPSSTQQVVQDIAFTDQESTEGNVKVDATATTSAICGGCRGESSALHVVYLPEATRVAADNAALAWTQDCRGCSATALSVQVVVTRQATAIPNNRALAVNAACEKCRSASAAFQVVLLVPGPERLSESELADLQVFVAQQQAVLREAVALETETWQIPKPSPTKTASPTATPTPTVRSHGPRRFRSARRSATALADLTALLVADLGGRVTAADVELRR